LKVMEWQLYERALLPVEACIRRRSSLELMNDGQRVIGEN
jgi:hypothetical protein